MKKGDVMAFFKKIAQDPDEGPDNTKECTACSGGGEIPHNLVTGKASDTARIQCPWCNGTGRVHR
jgi:DnaJ-class molecular chaperone